MACLILGDSIADGTAAALHAIAGASCTVVARKGASTDWIAHANPRRLFDSAVLSSGSNDANVAGLTGKISTLRATISARAVTWILPYNRRAARIVRVVATVNGDRWIDLSQLPSRDGIHPRSYIALARILNAAGDFSGLNKIGNDKTSQRRISTAMVQDSFTVLPGVLVFK